MLPIFTHDLSRIIVQLRLTGIHPTVSIIILREVWYTIHYTDHERATNVPFYLEALPKIHVIKKIV